MEYIDIRNYTVRNGYRNMVSSSIGKYLYFPKSYTESYWTFSDVIKVVGDALGVASLIPFSGSAAAF